MVGSDLLDAQGRWGRVNRKIMGIDDLDAVSGHVPQFAIGGLHNARTVAGRDAERSLTPSDASQTVISTLRFGSAIHASSSVRMIRTRPQAAYNQNEPSSSSMVQ